MMTRMRMTGMKLWRMHNDDDGDDDCYELRHFMKQTSATASIIALTIIEAWISHCAMIYWCEISLWRGG